LASLSPVPVEGIIAADLDMLYREDQARALQAILTAATARRVGKAYFPAELLVVHPLGIKLEEML
jgi:hypothetical protein